MIPNDQKNKLHYSVICVYFFTHHTTLNTSCSEDECSLKRDAVYIHYFMVQDKI